MICRNHGFRLVPKLCGNTPERDGMPLGTVFRNPRTCLGTILFCLHQSLAARRALPAKRSFARTCIPKRSLGTREKNAEIMDYLTSYYNNIKTCL
jgi:hypothetical protein